MKGGEAEGEKGGEEAEGEKGGEEGEGETLITKNLEMGSLGKCDQVLAREILWAAEEKNMLMLAPGYIVFDMYHLSLFETNDPNSLITQITWNMVESFPKDIYHLETCTVV